MIPLLVLGILVPHLSVVDVIVRHVGRKVELSPDQAWYVVYLLHSFLFGSLTKDLAKCLVELIEAYLMTEILLCHSDVSVEIIGLLFSIENLVFTLLLCFLVLVEDARE
jgi:hypothetical protein